MDLKQIPLAFRIHAGAILITVLLVGATVRYGIGGGLRHLRFLKMQERQYSLQLADQTSLRDSVGEGQAKLEQVRKQTAGLEQLVPSTMDFQGFFSSLNACAQAAHCELSGLQPGQPTTGDGFEEMQVPFKVNGDFPSLHVFLQSILNAPRICKLERLSIHAGAQGMPFQADVVLNIYCAHMAEASHAG